MMRDFTLKQYELLLQTAQECGLPIYGVREWLRHSPSKGILMRHDVDRRAENSLQMGELEHRYGVRSTYYFRVTDGSFHPLVIEQLAEWGHEIGYHYEDLATCHGDRERALRNFEYNLNRIRKLAPVHTIAMHGSPLSRWDNRTLWELTDFKQFQLEAEALISVDYRGIYYLTDSGRTWAETSLNLRDRVPGSHLSPVRTTPELCQFLRSNPEKRFAIVCHSERWDDALLPWLRQWLKDSTFNSIKWVLSKLRPTSGVSFSGELNVQ